MAFLLILGLLAAAEILVYLDGLDLAPGLGPVGLRLGVGLFALMITIIGGRVTPAFTANAIDRAAGPKVRAAGLIDRLAILAMVAFILGDLLLPSQIAGWLALIAGSVNGLRMIGWRTPATFGQPILWVLHLGYGWLVVGLLLVGVNGVLELPYAGEALHALTVGAIGTMTVGIMTRAGLGHTGRPIKAGPVTALAYLLISLAAAARIAPMAWPEAYRAGIMLSGLAWTLAFVIFAAIYGPLLLRPRADGKPG